MTFYISLFVFIAFFSYIYSKAKNKYIILSSRIICFLILFLPAALRYNIGRDYHSYVSIFNHPDMRNNLETGFKLLNQTTAYLGLDVQWIFAFMAFFTLYFLFKAVPRRIFYIVIVIYYAFFYTMSFNLVRQYFVISAGYYAIRLFFENKKFKSLLLIGASCLFHLSALLYFIILVLSLFFNINKPIALVLFILITIMNFIVYDIINVVISYILPHTPYGNFAESNEMTIKGKTNTGLGVLSRQIIMFILLIFYKDIKTLSPKIIFIFLCYYFFNILGIAINIFGRVAAALMPIVFFMIYDIHEYSVTKNKYFKGVLVLVYLWASISFIGAVRYYDYTLIPYKTIFSR